MREGENGELILEGATEARVASHLLLSQSADLAPLIAHMEPLLVEPRISWFDFISRRIEDAIGTGDKTQFVIRNPEIAKLAGRAILVTTVPTSLISFVPRGLTRPGFLRERAKNYAKHLRDQSIDQ